MYRTEDETRITQACVIPVAVCVLVVGVVVAGLVGSTARSGWQACVRSRSADRGARAQLRRARVAWPAVVLLALLFLTAAATAAQASPNIKHITRKAPTTEHTDADRLTWLLEFTEAVTNVDTADFVVTGTTAKLALTPLAVDGEGCSVKWDATLSGGDLAYLNGTVTLAPVADAVITILGCLGDGEIMTHAGPNGTNDNTFVLTNVPPPPPPPPRPPPLPPPPPGPSAPGAPGNLTAVGRIGQVVLSWEAPGNDGGAAITDYEYRIDRSPPWVSTGSTDTTHTVSGLDSGTTYVFEVRAVNRVGKSSGSNRAEAIPKVPEVLHFSHFANGDGSTSELVFVNVGTQPVRPALYFHETEGSSIAAESVVDIAGDLEVAEDGALTVRTGMEPLGELTISTHGREALVTGSVKVVSEGPVSGMLRFHLPYVGEAVVRDSTPIGDAIVPVRRRQGGINTGVAIHNLESTEAQVDCELLREGVPLDAASFALAANGQTSWLIDQAFAAADTSDFTGTVRCDAAGRARFSAIALEMDSGTRLFTTLPILEVNRALANATTEEKALNFAHFVNGESIISELVFVNLETWPSGPPISPFHPAVPPTRPVIYFHDPEGNPVTPETVVDITGDLEVTEDGGVTVRTEMEPLGKLTVSTHGRGPLVTGSVKVISEGPIGGMLRFDLPHVGQAVVGSSAATSDVIFPAQRHHGGINTAVAIHNLESREAQVDCELLREGVPLDAASFTLAANGQTSWSIDQAFAAADTSEFSGSVRCTAVGTDRFSAMALEMDSSARIFTTLPVVEVEERMSQE
ncbi:MAG: fibronectin type III domain-containing protein [Candidatus Aminicenantes bacterium]|nr:fibronectin type III domain-containing protein [Candidatus Aminicenantes bacterium]